MLKGLSGKGEGFEPSVPEGTPAYQAGALGHSANPPKRTVSPLDFECTTHCT